MKEQEKYILFYCLIGAGIGMFIVLVTAVPAIKRRDKEIINLENRIKFCDSINKINTDKFIQQDTTFDIAKEIIAKHLHKSN